MKIINSWYCYCLCISLYIFNVECVHQSFSTEATITSNNTKCLVDRPDPVERLWYHQGEILPIIIESTTKSSNLIVTYILAILYHEVVGFRDVEIKQTPGNPDIDSVMQNLTGCPTSFPWLCNDNNVASVPPSTVNAEVWCDQEIGQTADEWVETGYVVHAGHLGPLGRYGWYEPTYVMQYIYTERNIIANNWWVLNDPFVNELFYIDADLLDNLTLTDDGDGSRYCEDSNCVDGVFRVPSCPRNNSKCAVLLAEYADNNKDVLVDQVTFLQLNVTIAWIGPKLTRFVQSYYHESKPVLYFNWVPNSITASGNYTRIEFPNCIIKRIDRGCDFNTNILHKYAWADFQSGLPHAFNILMDMEFTPSQMDSLLTYQYSNHITEEETACDWVRENEDIWMSWIPGVVVNQTIYLGGFFPNTGGKWPQPGIEPAAHMAISAVNANSSILPVYNLDLHTFNTQCNEQLSMLAYLKYITDNEHTSVGIVGPACSDEAQIIAGMSTYFHNIMISYSSESPVLSDRSQYPHYYRTYPPATQFANCYVEFFEYWGWEQCATLTEDGSEFAYLVSAIHAAFTMNGIDVVVSRRFTEGEHSLDMSFYITEIKENEAHIVIGNFYEYAARAVICEAYKQGTTAHEGYQWFLPAWYARDWWDTDYYNEHENEYVHCTTQEMEKAVAGIMTFSRMNWQESNVTVVGDTTVREFTEQYLNIVDNLGIPPSPYAAYAYDAVWTIAIALDKLLEHDVFALSTITTNKTVQKYMGFIDESLFEGLSGKVFFDGPDRTSSIKIKQMFAHTSSFFGSCYPSGLGNLTIDESLITWVTGVPPNDGKSDYVPCVFGESMRKSLGIECSGVIFILVCIVLITITMIILSFCIFVKLRYDRKVRSTNARIKELGLLHRNADILTLDEWELARENVVLNRKLGEGAFGTVYGGEGLVDGKWLAVAVKTLKIGSSLEDKLDFLSEAEMMKQFDHINIVQLFGVCTRSEPAYTVMEYMLHGDLKTYLLSRRHLVPQMGSKEAELISPNVLTEMAFDIAAGLDYLSSMHFVHRDVACRNCLVHASHVVKLCDFGMARPLYDSDYYRFGKKGLLPVRWMSRESVIDGIFSTKSDVWSFGVVLYEIVTFGSFPYQGLANSEVVDALKRNETLNPPEGCNPVLKDLMKRCWSISPDDRPSPLEIMEIVGYHMDLITPCLESPMFCKDTTNCSIENQPPPLPPRPNRWKNKFTKSPLLSRKTDAVRRSHSTCNSGDFGHPKNGAMRKKISVKRSKTISERLHDINVERYKEKQERSRSIPYSQKPSIEEMINEENVFDEQKTDIHVDRSALTLKDTNQNSIIEINDEISHKEIVSDSENSSGYDSRHQSTGSQDSLLSHKDYKKQKKPDIEMETMQMHKLNVLFALSLPDEASSIV